MTKEDIIAMARRAGAHDNGNEVRFVELRYLERLFHMAQAAERNKVASWMMAQGYATGHGDTVEDLLKELEWQITESWSKVVVASVEAEREACAKVCDDWPNGREDVYSIGEAIRARGQA